MQYASLGPYKEKRRILRHTKYNLCPRKSSEGLEGTDHKGITSRMLIHDAIQTVENTVTQNAKSIDMPSVLATHIVT